MMIKSKLDLSYLETMSTGDTNTMRILLENLLSELNNHKNTARRLCETEDWAELDRFCHHFKSTLSFSGDKALMNANLKLWDCAKAQLKHKKVNPQVVQQQLTLLERNSQKVVQEVSRILKNI